MASIDGFVSQFPEADCHQTRLLRVGAQVAQCDSGEVTILPTLTESEQKILLQEIEHKWSHPVMFWMVIVLASMCAILQGMDETVINGAQPFFWEEFGVGPQQTWIRGLVNSAPYLCSALFSCWLTPPLNAHFGRTGTILICCAISTGAQLGQGLVSSWKAMLAIRLVLGLAIGPVSGTVPIFTAEIAPSCIRGACVMFWQIFTAFGIMLGFVVSLTFQPYAFDSNLDRLAGIIHDPSSIRGLGWRLIMASPVVPSLIIAVLIKFVPESPRWYMHRGQYDKAYQALCRLRKAPLLAARDCYLLHVRYTREQESRKGHGFAYNMKQILFRPRNRRSMYASQSLMFMQQFSGINVIAYYSSEIFRQAGFGNQQALLVSFGFGLTNFVFALPAFFTIDSFGRRPLLLVTFPAMAICLLITGLGFIAPSRSDARTGVVAAGIYLFTGFYSSGAGPMPFTYSSEAYAQEVRSEGMALATATTWGFNSILALTWPPLLAAFGPIAAFCYYAVWNLIGYLLTLFLVPETKGQSLEDLDAVFSIPTARRAQHAANVLVWGVKSVSCGFKSAYPRPRLPDAATEDMAIDHEKQQGPQSLQVPELPALDTSLIIEHCDTGPRTLSSVSTDIGTPATEMITSSTGK